MSSQGSQQIVMLLLFFAVAYFFLIRPEKKKRKQAEQLRSSLKKGDKITTIGGIVGTIVTVAEDTMVIETSEDRVRMELAKWAVSTTGVQSTAEADAKKKKKSVEELPEEPVDEIPAGEEPADEPKE